MSNGHEGAVEAGNVISFPGGENQNPGEQEHAAPPVEQASSEQIGGEPSSVEPPAPVVLKARTLLRDTFMRLWRVGQQMHPEGIAIVMLCPECHSMIQLGLQGAQITELKCACTVWSIRAIHI